MYLAILISIGILFIWAIIDIVISATLQLSKDASFAISLIPLLLTSIWAGFDARKIEFKKYKTSLGSTIHGGGGVFAGVLALWIIFFPWYLYSRGKILSGKAKLRDEYEGEAIKRLQMKKQIICRNCGSVGLPRKRYGVRLTLALISWAIPVLILLGIFEYIEPGQNESTIVEFANQLVWILYNPQMLIHFLFWWSLALILTISILLTRRIVCFECGAKKNSLVPLDTPEGKRLLNQSEETQKIQFKKEGITSSLYKTCETDIATQLERLAKLKDKGVLTNEEFRAQKEKLLSS